jgi:hypothetical protein
LEHGLIAGERGARPGIFLRKWTGRQIKLFEFVNYWYASMIAAG